MSSSIRVTIASSPHHECVFAELSINNKIVLILTREPGCELEIEIPGPGYLPEFVAKKVTYQDLLTGIEMARRRLEGEPQSVNESA